MLTGLLGRKIGMTQIFTESGEMVPVTVIEVGPGYVVQKKNVETDGYEAIQLGFCFKHVSQNKKINRPTLGRLKKAGLDNVQITHFKEFKTTDVVNMEVGQKITCDFFKEGEKVDVSGLIKGRGFAGGMKRYGWHGQPASHGSMMHRRPGSIGQSSSPSRVLKGTTLPGQYGNVRQTVMSLTIRRVDVERNLILVEGAIPGWTSAVVEIKKAAKTKRAKS